MNAAGDSAQQLAASILAETVHWAGVIRQKNIKPE